MARAILTFLALCSAFSFGAPAVPAIDAVLNSATLTPSLAPGTLTVVRGVNLSPGPASADGVPLPFDLSGVSVEIFGTAVPLRAVSDTQITFVIPFEIDLMGAYNANLPLVVKTPDGTSLPFPINLQRSAPGILTQDGTENGPALVFDVDGNPVSSIGADPIVLQATGLGPVDPPGSSTTGGSADEPYNLLVDDLVVFVGDTPAAVQSVRLAPGLPGVYEVRVLPQGPISNRVFIETQRGQKIETFLNQKRSNVATLPIPVGLNVTNVTGSVEGVYPSSGLPACDSDPDGLACLIVRMNFSLPVPMEFISISEMPFVGSFAVSFDINPDAQPFQVISRCNGVSQVITIDPASASWQAAASSPTPATRVFDFSRLDHPVIDFTTQSPLPGNIFPASRISLSAVRALNFLPFPNSDDVDNDNRTFKSLGSLDDPSHVDWHGILRSPLTFFGGFSAITEPPQDPPKLNTARFELFVDGLLVATRLVTYGVY